MQIIDGNGEIYSEGFTRLIRKIRRAEILRNTGLNVHLENRTL